MSPDRQSFRRCAVRLTQMAAAGQSCSVFGVPQAVGLQAATTANAAFGSLPVAGHSAYCMALEQTWDNPTQDQSVSVMDV